MGNFLRKLRPPWDERQRLIVAGLGCIALLLAALLLPLAFRRTDAPPAGEETQAPTLDEKSALFAAWWYDGGAALEVAYLETPDAATAAFCEARMAELTSRCIDDRALGDPEATGAEYVSVTDGAAALRLCRMWIQAKGDWQNWLDVCFDADTGLVYYLYLSRECLSNRSLYALPEAERPTAESVAEGLAAEAGGTLRRFLADGAGGGTALVLCADGTLCYTVGCTYYDALVDVRIGCI